jgi:hypothetical protein
MTQGRPVQVESPFSVGGLSPGVGLATTAVAVGLAVAVFGTPGVALTVGDAGDVDEGEAAVRVGVATTPSGGQAVSTAI